MNKTKANYAAIRYHLTHLQEFKGNSMSATIVDHPDHRGKVYQVKSYSTVVATWDDVRGTWITDQHYSVTTSRHVNLCRVNLPEAR